MTTGPKREHVLLRGVEIFKSLDDQVIARLAQSLERFKLARGETLVRQGEPGDSMFILTSGQLRVVTLDLSGDEVVVAHIGPGEPVGEMQAIVGGIRLATVIADADCELVKLPRSAIDQVGGDTPQVLEALTSVVRRRLQRNQLARLVPAILGSVETDVIDELENKIEWVRLRRGEAPFRQGDECDGWYAVASGRLQVVVTHPNGDEEVVGEVGTGEGLGELAIFTGEARAATPYAVRETVLMRFSQEAFEDVLLRYPQALMSITKVISKRMMTSIARRARKDQTISVAVVPAGPGAPLAEFSHGLAKVFGEWQPTLHLDSRRLATQGVLDNAWTLAESHPHWLRFAAWFEEQYLQNGFFVLEADDRPTGWSRRATGCADHVVIIADATASPEPGEVESAVTSSTRETNPRRARRTLVLVHPPDTKLPSGTREWLSRRDVDSHYHIRAGNEADIARVARALSGRAVGLALGGGGARGFAHLGVVKALRELRIPIDFIGGTSMGAIMAAQVSLGLSMEELYDLNRRLIATKPFADYTVPMVALLATTRLERGARISFGDTMIEDLWINYFAISSNLSTAKMVVHDSGPVWEATRASGSLPGIAVPLIKDSHLLVDGGVVNNLPGDVMRTQCGGYVIAVNVSPEEELKVSVDGIPSQWRIFWNRILPFSSKRIDAPSILDILMRTTMLASASHAAQVARSVDLYLNPPIEGYGMLEIEKMEEIVECGYNYTIKAAADWKGPRC